VADHINIHEGWQALYSQKSQFCGTIRIWPLFIRGYPHAHHNHRQKLQTYKRHKKGHPAHGHAVCGWLFCQ
jgi:hypothetical protein